MARFIDLENEADGQAQQLDVGKPLPLPLLLEGAVMTNSKQQQQQHHQPNRQDESSATAAAEEKAKLPLVRNAMTKAFRCYPIVVAIVSYIDLNTLDALARTSRLIHDGLIQYRTSLMSATLRCSYERMPVDPDQTLSYRARARNGKSGSCARDMVAECRRCAKVICRNCVIKPPAPAALHERHRRLCLTCAKAPIAALASPPLDISLPLTCDSVQHAVCKCNTEGVWLCQPCGRSMRNADHEYKRIWRWRNQYGEVLGGLGTGIGDGDRGVICGREESCLAAREREHEIDCDAEDARSTNSAAPTPPAAVITGINGGFPFPAPAHGTIESLIDEIRYEQTPSPQLGPGYERHEIEGIGGIVKRKLVRMVRVGACVPEWEDEKGGMSGSGKVLAREVNGVARSWCGWCWRVIPGKKDKDQCSAAIDQRHL